MTDSTDFRPADVFNMTVSVGRIRQFLIRVVC